MIYRTIVQSSSSAVFQAVRSSARAPLLAACTCSPSSCAPRSFSSSPSRLRIADDFVNMIQLDADRPIPQIASITPKQGFTLTDGLIVPSPLIFLNGVTFLWDVAPPNPHMGSNGLQEWEGWDLKKLKVFETISPRPEILLVGTGQRGMLPPPHFKKYLNGLGIQVDVLDSRNACSTYNLLAEEGRRVAAALYPLAPLDARTGVEWARE